MGGDCSSSWWARHGAVLQSLESTLTKSSPSSDPASGCGKVRFSCLSPFLLLIHTRVPIYMLLLCAIRGAHHTQFKCLQKQLDRHIQKCVSQGISNLVKEQWRLTVTMSYLMLKIDFSISSMPAFLHLHYTNPGSASNAAALAVCKGPGLQI